jgi:hypothetical protein
MENMRIKHRDLDTNPEMGNHWEHLSIEVRVVLKYNLKEEGEELRTGLGSREESGSWEISNEFSGYTKDKIILD